MNAQTLPRAYLQRQALRLNRFWINCKPRVNALIVFTAMIGMILAQPGLPDPALFLLASLGIALVSGAAAAFNCTLEAQIDRTMKRTAWRPVAKGLASELETLILATVVGGIGLSVLGIYVNALTMWLTLGTFIGYAVIYTLWLKPTTPMNIVIGGASGAMPPILGMSSMTGVVSVEGIVLFLIIFLWTPPHFWALACCQREEYAKSGLPMLPITHGVALTTLHIVLYTLLTVACSLIPVSLGMSGVVYLVIVAPLGMVFLWLAVQLWQAYSDQKSRQLFRYSIVYLSGLFVALLVDHWL